MLAHDPSAFTCAGFRESHADPLVNESRGALDGLEDEYVLPLVSDAASRLVSADDDAREVLGVDLSVLVPS